MDAAVLESPQSAPLRQGIQGQVTRLSGNHMPSPNPNSGQRENVQTTVWIFAGRIAGPGPAPWPVAEAEQHPGLVGRVESDRNGHYAMALPVGEYTLLAQYEDYLYLNSFQGDGSYQSVQVTPNQVVEFNLINTENAFF
ncbi:MAG: carboxypeptidase-like regulatory domain-containing protein [Nodosilinea sp.]